jgi:predicted secreted protein
VKDINALLKDQRSRKIILVAHCILNQNSRVSGLANHAGMIDELVKLLLKKAYGVFQIPCPELIYGGLKRWSQTKEQYDTPMFRKLCREIAKSVTEQVKEYLKSGVNVALIIGVEGSPSCGVDETSKGYLGGIVEQTGEQKSESVKGSGILIEELRSELKRMRISIPFYGMKHTRLKNDIRTLDRML